MGAKSSGWKGSVHHLCAKGPPDMRKKRSRASTVYAWTSCTLPRFVPREESTIARGQRLT